MPSVNGWMSGGGSTVAASGLGGIDGVVVVVETRVVGVAVLVFAEVPGCSEDEPLLYAHAAPVVKIVAPAISSARRETR